MARRPCPGWPPAAAWLGKIRQVRSLRLRLGIDLRKGNPASSLASRAWLRYTGNRVRWPDGRGAPRKRRVEESPGSTETRCRLTAGEGDLRDSATEMTPPTGPSSFG